MKDEIKKHLDVIRYHLKSNRAVLFIGAGLSRNAEAKFSNVTSRYKTWTEFIEQLACQLWPELYTSNRELFNQKILGNNLLISQFFEEEFGKEAFYNELLKAVPYREYKPSDIHRRILDLPWRDIVTTNQDTLIEQSLDELHKNYDEIIDDIDIPVKTGKLKVYKMHGSIERPSTIIFTEEQYRTYENNHPLMYVKLKALFAEFSVVFMGFSLTDPNFKNIYGWVQDVLKKEYQRKAYAFVYKSEMDTYTKRYWEKKNIILLPIEGNFADCMKEYVEYFKKDVKDVSKETHINEVNTFFSKYENIDNKNIEQMIRDLREILNAKIDRYEIRRLLDFIRNKHNDVNLLSDKHKFTILTILFQVLPPYYHIFDKPIIDSLIEITQENKGLVKEEILYSYFVSKANGLLRLGRMREATEYIDKILEKNKIDKINLNNLLLFKVMAFKYEFNTKEIAMLLDKVNIYWNDMDSLNIIGQAYAFIGSKERALDIFHKALELSKEKKDDWWQFVSLINIITAINNNYICDKFTHDKITKLSNELSSLKNKLIESKNNYYNTLVEYEKIKDNWNEFREWKSHNKDSSLGFNSRKNDVYITFYEAIHFIETNGLPNSYLAKSVSGIIDEVFQENRNISEGIKFSIFFKDVKSINRILDMDTISYIVKDEKEKIFKYTEIFYNNLNQYINFQNNNLLNLNSWMTGVLTVWEKLIHASNDEKIRHIAEKTIEVLKLSKHDKYNYDLVNAIIKLLSESAYYLNSKDYAAKLIESMELFKEDYRIISHSFYYIPWELVSHKLKVSDELINMLLKYKSFILYNFIENNIVSDKQISMIYDSIYKAEELPDANLYNGINELRVYLMKFFKDRLDEKYNMIIIDNAIEEFRKGLSSWDVRYLYILGQISSSMSEKQFQSIRDSIKNKLDRLDEDKEFIIYHKHELVSAYLFIYYKFLSEKKEKLTELYNEFINYKSFLNRSTGEILDETYSEESKKYILPVLLEGIKMRESGRRVDYINLSGVYLSKIKTIDTSVKALLSLLVAGINDSNIIVASESVRAWAFIIKGRSEWINEYITQIVDWTKNTVNIYSISYLTNLAFLYKVLVELSDSNITDKLTKGTDLFEDINRVYNNLLESELSTVRREARQEEQGAG